MAQLVQRLEVERSEVASYSFPLVALVGLLPDDADVGEERCRWACAPA